MGLTIQFDGDACLRDAEFLCKCRRSDDGCTYTSYQQSGLFDSISGTGPQRNTVSGPPCKLHWFLIHFGCLFGDKGVNEICENEVATNSYDFMVCTHVVDVKE